MLRRPRLEPLCRTRFSYHSRSILLRVVFFLGKPSFIDQMPLEMGYNKDRKYGAPSSREFENLAKLYGSVFAIRPSKVNLQLKLIARGLISLTMLP